MSALIIEPPAQPDQLCHRGHDQVYFDKIGHRRCRVCQRENDRRTRERRRAASGADHRVPVPAIVVDRLRSIHDDPTRDFLEAMEMRGFGYDWARRIVNGDSLRIWSRDLDRLVIALGLVGFVDVLTGKAMV